MSSCLKCGRENKQVSGKPASLDVCFSCYLADAAYCRQVTVDDSEAGAELWISADDGKRRLQQRLHGFEDRDAAMTLGEVLADKIRVTVNLELELDGNYVIIGVRNRDDAEAVQRILRGDPLSNWVENVKVAELDDLYDSETLQRYDGQPLFSRRLCWQMAMWRAYNFPGRVGPGGPTGPRRGNIELDGVPCVFNSVRGLSSDIADDIQSGLVEHFVDAGGFDAVETLSDIRSAACDLTPVGSHIFPRLRRDLGNYARDNKHHLSPRSRKAIEANEVGKKLEHAFRDICDVHGVECWTANKLFALRHQLNRLRAGKPDYLPSEKYDLRLRQVEDEYAKVPADVKSLAGEFDGEGGFPDFIVWGNRPGLEALVQDHSEGLGAGSDALLVEAKYTSDPSGNPDFTDAQEERIPELMELGAEVLVFRGTPEHHWLKEPSF